MEKKNILFLCTGNSCRSQIAEGFLRKYAGDIFEPFSAGLDPKPIHPMTFRVMDEAGIDIRSQRSKSIDEYLAKIHFDYAVFVCKKAEQNCPHAYLPDSIRLSWPFPDPAAVCVESRDNKEWIDIFRSVRNQIERKIQEWVASIRENLENP